MKSYILYIRFLYNIKRYKYSIRIVNFAIIKQRYYIANVYPINFALIVLRSLQVPTVGEQIVGNTLHLHRLNCPT